MAKKVLHAEEYEFVYESQFEKFQKKVITYQVYIFAAFVGVILFASNFSPILTFTLSIFLFMALLFNFLAFNDTSKDVDIIGVHGENEEYFVHFGNAVTSIDDVFSPVDTVRNPKKYRDKILYPIIFKDTQFLVHQFIVGTTGAGKTTFLINILKQILTLGGGCMAVDGKGDQTVYEAFYNTAIDCGREDDFLVINFNVPTESNTFNPLLKGDTDEISDIIGNMLDTGGDNAFWAGRALTMMKGVLSVTIPLRDQGLLYTPQKEKINIYTLGDLVKWIDLTNLKDLYFTIKDANELGYLDIDCFTQEEKDKYEPISLDRLESYLSSVYVDLHSQNAKISESSAKQHGNSFLMWNEALDMLSGRFGAIFDTANPTIDMEDIVTNGRILYVLLPSLKVDPRTLSTIGKIVLSLFKNAIATLLGDKIAGTIEVRYRSFAKRPRVPFWGVMDEYGSYAVEGFDNVLAQARSLKVGVAILVQEIASLKKTSEIESQRLLGNTGIKVALKVEEQKTAEELVEFLGKSEQATIKVRSEGQDINERDIEVTEKNILTVTDIKKLQAGHAYIMWAGETIPALVAFYEPPITKEIPEFSLFDIITSANYVIADYAKDIDVFDDDEYEDNIVKMVDNINQEFDSNITLVNNYIDKLSPIEISETQNELNNILGNINSLLNKHEEAESA
jgi:hypothetical protein